MISLDDPDGGRCGGVPAARIEDGHAHGFGGSEGLRVELFWF